MNDSVILLIDNGSKRAAATLQLRGIAEKLTSVVGQTVHPVSLQHADSIDPADLEGRPARLFTEFVREQLQNNVRSFHALPLLFGNSRALTSFIPQQLEKLTQDHGEFELRLAISLYPLPEGEPMLAEILRDHVTHTISQQGRNINHVVLVEHGSPLPEVNQVRREVADQLQDMLRESGDIKVDQAVMERRKGKQYDFNGELLEDWLSLRAKEGVTDIVVAMLFLLPGRHAGDGGDIQTICNDAMSSHPGLNISITPLVGEHEMIIDILASRLKSVQEQ